MTEQPPHLVLPPSRYGLPAALVRERGFTWSCAGVTAGLVGTHLAGLSLWTCPFLSVTGLPCPGCGLTRSCGCLLRGELAQSVTWHAFGPLLFLLGLTGFAGSLLPDAPRRRFAALLQQWDTRLRFTPLLFGALVIYSLTRWFLPR